MKFRRQGFLCFVICLCMLVGCSTMFGPGREYFEGLEQGLYPDSSDFPNTKWECRELDLWFYMLDYCEWNIVGVYTVNNKQYRAVGKFFYNRFELDFYESTEVTSSIRAPESELIHCNTISCGTVITDYRYVNGVIICEMVNHKAVDGESIPTTLTFEKTETIAQNPTDRWYAAEIDMYIQSFSDAEDYFAGEIAIDGQKCFTHGFEIGNSNYYLFRVSAGNYAKNGVVGDTLIYLYLEIYEDRIVAKVTDDHLAVPEACPYWKYKGNTITFYKVSDN